MDIKAFFDSHSEVAVAFSGGVDSAVLLLLAGKYAKRVKAYYVKSPFQPQFELEDARRLAAALNVALEVLEVNVLADTEIAKNPKNRCYYCKKAIFRAIIAAAEKDGFQVILDGTNASDDIGDRPGYQALQELQVLSPLKSCGFTKARIRQTARKYGLPVADKPSYACLATRIPAGTPISQTLLEKTERAENALRAIGFRNFRVRWYNGSAKLELSRGDFARLYETKNEVYALLAAEYKEVLLDLKERADE